MLVEVSIKVLNGAGSISERMGRRDVELKTRSAHDLRLIGEAEDIGDECGAALYRCLIPVVVPLANWSSFRIKLLGGKDQLEKLNGFDCMRSEINLPSWYHRRRKTVVPVREVPLCLSPPTVLS